MPLLHEAACENHCNLRDICVVVSSSDLHLYQSLGCFVSDCWCYANGDGGANGDDDDDCDNGDGVVLDLIGSGGGDDGGGDGHDGSAVVVLGVECVHCM
ncbi:Hypothetical predicted protein [Olea europaea subsp. europaea]|uniref:Uncharacterized protein n=1 Tax=Olea europaea subsp. europaea TaxID=158383 RepID=A0A8S0VIT5_OLEEU|nr:Hypothetical predicted protein [Olea europaea subsp. europaea]